MFTGLVEQMGRIGAVQRSGADWVLRVTHEPWDRPLDDGESVSVQGVCLTVCRHEEGQFACNALDETLTRTSLGARGAGAAVNLERALRVGDRLGGHLVSGHVDGIGAVEGFSRTAADWVLRVGCRPAIADGVVARGSVTIDGVSLTVTGVRPDRFEVHVIPFTWDHTTLGGLKPGDPVNVELDMIGKYVRKYLEGRTEGDGGLAVRDLIRSGVL